MSGLQEKFIYRKNDADLYKFRNRVGKPELDIFSGAGVSVYKHEAPELDPDGFRTSSKAPIRI